MTQATGWWRRPPDGCRASTSAKGEIGTLTYPDDAFDLVTGFDTFQDAARRSATQRAPT